MNAVAVASLRTAATRPFQKKKNVLLRRSGSGSGQQEEGGRREGEKEDPCPIFHTNISYKKLRAWCSERNRGYGSGREEE